MTIGSKTFALSRSQQNIWNVEQSYQGTPINNISSTMLIRGRFDVTALQACLNAAIEADMSLRTRIVTEDGVPCQYYADFASEQFPVFDFSQTGAESVRHWEETTAREPIPLLKGPLYRFAIFRVGENEGGVLVKTHHIITDGWSQVLLGNRLSQGYLNLLAGEDAQIKPSQDYRMHVGAEEEYLRSPFYEKDRQYWKRKLEEMAEPASLKKQSSAEVSPVGRRKTFVVSEVLNHAVQRFCTENRVAPFAVFYMALAVYLRRALGLEVGAVGVPIHNRSDFREKQTTGMFVSTIPLLCSLDENWSFEEFNRHLKEEWFELLRHQKLPFSEIAEIGKQSHPGMKDLFQIVLSYQNGQLFKNKDASVSFSGRWHYSGYQAENLVIHVSSLEETFRFSIDYDFQTQIFSEGEIEKLHRYLTKILADAMANPGKPIWQLSLLGNEEEEQVLFGFNHTDKPLAAKSIARAMQKVAEEYATRVALISDGKRLRYDELWNRAKCFAQTIEAACPEESLVAISLPKGFSLLEAMLGTALAKNAWVILPPALPEERKQAILEESGAALLITDRRKDSVPTPVLCVEDVPLTPLCGYIPKEADGGDLAYVVYTSGSTGAPKGVEITQENLMNFTAAMEPLYGHGGVLSVCNTGFDAFILESVVSLMNGCTVILADEKEGEDPSCLARLIRDFAVGFIAMTPSRLRTYLRHADFARALRRVESIVCGGEHISGALVKELEKWTRARIYNQYGPSETTVGVSVQLLNGAARITAGKPMDNCRMYILDRNMQPLPIGVYGDLYIGGKCVGRGYRNAPVLTEQSFFNSPFEQGERLYKTGDVACWQESGEVVIGGRGDEQVKLRGVRIEPQEIAACLMRHPKVNEAAVKLVQGTGAPFLAAYYTAEEPVQDTELLRFAAMYLPGYMLPACLVFVEKMPTSANGKIDLNRLPAPKLRTAGQTAQTEGQRILLEIFCEVLGRDGLDIDSDYFLMGGDSLNAVELVCRIQEKIGIEIKIADLYALRTVRNLSRLIPGGEKKGQPDRIPAAPRLPSYPLSGVQKNLYVQARMDADGVSYNMPGAFVLDAELDAARLQDALQKLVQEEELLRTSFSMDEHGARQTVHGEANLAIERLEARSFEEAAQKFVRPFDLAKAPLMRAALWENHEQRVLLIDTHHIISDGISSRILMERLDTLYCGGSPASPRISYKDYACWQETQEEKKSEAAAFWKTQFENGVPELELPADVPADTPSSRQDGGKYEFPLGMELSARCEACCREHDITPFMFLAGTFAILLSRITGKEDIVLGVPVSGRTKNELWDMFGAFVNTLPLRVAPKKNCAAQEYFENVRQAVTGMLDHQEIGLEEIMNLAGVKRAPGYNPFTQVLFALRPVSEDEFHLGGKKLEYRPIHTGTAKFDLSLEAAQRSDGFVMIWDYARPLFEERTIAFYARCFAALLKEILSAEAQPLGAFSALAGGDCAELIELPRYVRVPYVDLCLDQLIERMTALLPDAPAVYCGGQTLSYRELEQRAEGYAAQLQQEGAEHGGYIGLCCGRTVETLPAILGILKAGCAYIPILPSIPEARIRYMLEQSGAEMLLCDAASLRLLPGNLPCKTVILKQREGFTPACGRASTDDIHIIFTSGSTGAPKGVVLQHRAIANLLPDLKQKYEGLPGNAVCVSSMMFDTFLMDTLLPLAFGRAVVLADEEEMLLPWKLGELIQKYDVCAVFMTPSRWQMCLADDAFLSTMQRIGAVMSGGEAMSGQLRERMRQAAPDATIYNMYGPTETAIYVAWADVTAEERKPVIGRANPNCRLYVLDEEQRPSLPTARGELYIAGECLARGYINQPELTEQAFVPDPFFPGEKMYRTGDIVRLLADGCIDYAGRKDRQVKLNGQRIELSEITGEILRSGEAKDAAVVPRKKTDGSMELQAFIVPCRDDSPKRIRTHLRRHLPAYMIPSSIFMLDRLPQTATGKTDLLALEARGQTGGKQNHAQGDTLEARITAIWSAVLEHRADPEVPFFEQGGTSLAALNVLGQYLKNGWDLSIADFYETPTISGQMRLLAAGDQTESAEREREQKTETGAGRVETLHVPERKTASLITGATGFLGAHLVKELADANERCICLVRDANGAQRLRDSLIWYFGGEWLGAREERIEVVRGDVTLPDLGIAPGEAAAVRKRTRQVIHAAADVRHYMAEEQAVLANCTGTEQAAAFARGADARLLHVSTLSVSGSRLAADPQRSAYFSEDDLDIGQNWRDNVYVKSKFMAEERVKEAVQMGLQANIFRVGRLVGRSTDGKFQQNPERNSFFAMIRGLGEIGSMPKEYAEMMLELTAVDLCARAILLLGGGKQDVYHIANPKFVSLKTVMEELWPGTSVMESAVFRQAVARKAAEAVPEKVYPMVALLSGLEDGEQRIRVRLEKTTEALGDRGFFWDPPNIKVLLRAFGGGRTI